VRITVASRENYNSKWCAVICLCTNVTLLSVHSTLLPIRTVATAVKAMCKCWGRVLDAVRILSPSRLPVQQREYTLLSYFEWFVPSWTAELPWFVTLIRERCCVRIPASALFILAGYPWFLQSCQENAGTLPRIRSRPFPSKYFPTHRYAIIKCIVRGCQYNNRL
jgi:hypothetical protein